MKLNREQLQFFFNEVLDVFGWDDEIEETGVDPLAFIRDEVGSLRRALHHKPAIDINEVYSLRKVLVMADQLVFEIDTNGIVNTARQDLIDEIEKAKAFVLNETSPNIACTGQEPA
jgi:hypothetical protein